MRIHVETSPINYETARWFNQSGRVHESDTQAYAIDALIQLSLHHVIYLDQPGCDGRA